MNTNKKILIFGIFIFIIAGILFLSAQLTEIEGISSTDFSYSGEGVELINDELFCQIEKCTIQITKGDVTTTIEATQGTKFDPVSGRISVTESGAEFSINGNKFSNIDSGEIILDQTNGKITEAKFFTNSNGGTYEINGNKFSVPGDKEFVYPSKKGVEGFLLPDGTEVLEAQKNIQIETLKYGSIKYKGNDVNGVLNFDENGNAFVKIREKVVINGVSIENNGPISYARLGLEYDKELNLPVFFDKKSLDGFEKANPRLNYILIEPESFVFKEHNGVGLEERSIKIEFKKENYLFGDLMDEQDYVAINSGSNNKDGGYLEISRPAQQPIVVKNKGGGIVLENGARDINFNGRKAYSSTRTQREKIGTVSMILETEDLKDEKGNVIEEGIVGLYIENKEYNRPEIYWMDKKSYGKLSIEGVGYLAGEVDIPEDYAKKLKDASSISQEDFDKVKGIIGDPSFKGKLEASKLADKELKDLYNNEQIGLKEVIRNNPQGISFQQLENEIGAKNAQRVKNGIEEKIRVYYDYYSPSDRNRQLRKIMGVNELNNFNNCMSQSGVFHVCFDQEYKFYGHLSERCIIDPDFCPIINAVTLYKTSSI